MTARRTFFATLALSLCLLGLVLSLFLINYNIRTTVYGAVEFSLSYRMEAGLPILTDRSGNPVWEPPAGAALLVPAPTRLLAELYGRLAEALP